MRIFGRQHLHFDHSFKTAPEPLFDLLADHERFGEIWGSQLTRIRAGNDPGEINGVGSIRRCEMGGLSYEETITGFDRPNEIAYTVSKGSAAKNHLGRIRLSETQPGTTRLAYDIEFDARLPLTGPLVARFMRKAWQAGAVDRIRAALPAQSA